MPQHRPVSSYPQGVGVIDAVASGQGCVDQRQGLGPDVGMPGRLAQDEVLLEELGQAETLGQGAGENQAGMRNKLRVINRDVEVPVSPLARPG
jgi:hypothetical protein